MIISKLQRILRYPTLLLLALCIATGCSNITNLLSADPAPSAGFIPEPEKLKP